MTGLLLLFAILGLGSATATMRSIVKALEEDAAYDRRRGVRTFPPIKVMRSLLVTMYVTFGLLLGALIVYCLER